MTVVIDIFMLRRQRNWLLSLEDTDENKGLTALCDYLIDQREVARARRVDVQLTGGTPYTDSVEVA